MGKIAIVTGGAKGIGYGSSKRLLADGFIKISEKDEWNLLRNNKYFFTCIV